MKIRNLIKLIFFVLFLFVLIGCNEYGVSVSVQETTTEIQSTDILTNLETITTIEETTVLTTEETTEIVEDINTLSYENQFIIAEALIKEYLNDYSNPEITNEELIEQYFYGDAFEGFYEERNSDLENDNIVEYVSIDFRLDGAFDIEYRAIKGDDRWERKQPGRIIYKSATRNYSIDWLQESDEIAELCDDVLNKEDTLTVIEAYFNDYLNREISNEALARMYYAGNMDKMIISQREKDLENNVSIVIIDVIRREEDSYFDILYEVRKGDDQWERKQPGRIRYQELKSSTLIIWKTDEISNALE